MMDVYKEKALKMSPEEAGKLLGCHKDEVEFHERWQIMLKMHNDEEFTQQVITHFKPPYFIQS